MQTLDAFLREANLPADTGASSRDALTIEQVLREKSTFDLSNSFEKVTVDSHATRWSLPGKVSWQLQEAARCKTQLTR